MPLVLRSAALVPVAMALSSCFRDRDTETVTAAERAAYSAPTDSTLTSRQVDLYLRTTIAQLDLVGVEAPAFRAGLARPASASEPAVPAMKRWSDYLRGAYVRAARRVDANPAEMEFVGERMRAVGSYLGTRGVQASGPQLAAILRDQAETLRRQPGTHAAQIEALSRAAAEAEGQTIEPPPVRLRQNLQLLHASRPHVTDDMWQRIARVSGGVGLMSLGDMADTTAQGVLGQIDAVRALYQAALEDRAEQPQGP